MTRYQALIIAGVLCGIAGAYLSTAHGSGFVREMTAGKGYIALAAMIFGKWQPRGALLACLLFGFLEAVASRLQGVELPLIGEAPVNLILAMPYSDDRDSRLPDLSAARCRQGLLAAPISRKGKVHG